MTGLARRIRKWVAGIFAGAAILLAVLVGAFRIFVSQAPDYRQPIADWASGLLGVPVDIERLDVRFALGGPELVLGGATVYSLDRSQAMFSASQAIISVDVSELLIRWRLAADTFTLDGLTLDVDRAASGEFFVINRRIDEFPRTGSAAIQDLRVRNSIVRVRDHMDGGRTWVLTDVEVLFSSSGGRTRIEGRFAPPPEVASDCNFWAIQAQPEHWQTYAGLKNLKLAGLKQIPSVPDLIPNAGTGDVRLWLDLKQGIPSRISAETQLRDVTVAFGTDPPATFSELGGRIEWDRLATGWRGRAQDLVISRAGDRWNSSQLLVERRRVGGRQEGDLYVDADFLRLDDLMPFAPLVPDESLRESLAAMQVSGDVTGLTAHLAVVDKEPRGFQIEASAELSNVSFQPYGNLPGVRGFSGQVRSDPKGGRVELESRGLALTFPKLFRDSLEFDTAQGLVVWSRGSDGLTLIGDGILADNRDLNLQAGFRFRFPTGDEEGRIDVQATVTDVDVSSTSRYLPVGIMSQKVVAWLDSAVVSGRVPVAELNLSGPTRGFPYADGQGVFEVSFGARDLELQYASDWPRASGVSADLLFRGPGFYADVTEGVLAGARVDSLRVEIPVLREGMLSIEGTADSSLAAVRTFALESPLKATLGEALGQTRVEQGDANIQVDILLPLKDLSARDVLVELGITDGQVYYGQISHPLESVDGEISVRNSQVRGNDIDAVFLDRPASIDIAPLENGATRAYIDSSITRTALVDVLNLPMERYLEGEARWTGFAHFPAAGSGESFRIHLDSDLAGMAVGLPYPVAKTAEAALPLSIDFEFPEIGITQWTAGYGDRLSAQARFEIVDKGIDFLAANVRLGGDGARIDQTKGLAIVGNVDRLPVLQWLGVRFGDRGEGRLEDVLTRIDVSAGRASFGSQYFYGVTARLEQDDDQWLLDLDGESIRGTVRVPMRLGPESPVVLDMERLYLSDREAEGEAEALDPKVVPSLNIAAEDFRLAGLRMGRLEAEVRSVPNGFRLEHYTLQGPSHSIEGDGYSLLGFGQDNSAITLEATTSDMGATMEYMGFERTMESSSAKFSADLTWRGGVPSETLEVATGTARLDIGSGSLTEVKPGAGRVFGLLSVQALPRRLTLDFRDVFKKGFYFDKFRGDFQIAEGRAYTDNLVFRSPAADIGIVGYVNLVDRLYDQTAIVSADVGNTLPVVGAIAAGPAIGAGLFVLKEIFKEPLRGMINVQYRITGPWDNPEVVRVAAAEIEGAAPAQGAGEETPEQQTPQPSAEEDG